MEGFTQFAAGFCIVCIITGAISVIVPEGSFKKPIKYIISLCFIAVVFGFALNINPNDFEIKKSETEALSESAVELNLKQTFSLALTQNGINFSEIEVLTDKSVNDSISIIEVVVYTSASRDEVCRVIEETEQIKVSVINE